MNPNVQLKLDKLQGFLGRIKRRVFHSEQVPRHLYQWQPLLLGTNLYSQPNPHLPEEDTLPIYTGIGVGVYRGHCVILRGLAKAYFSQNWVVERLRSDNLHHITKQQAFQLYSLATLLLLIHQHDHEENDLQILDEIELATDCPYATQPQNLESPLSEAVCDSDDCPLQKLLLRVLPQEGQSQYLQYLLCPLSPLIHQG